jgi:hypothetical protein
MTSKEIDGEWPEPVACDFSGRFNDLEPLLSPDGSTLLFGSRRNVPDAEVVVYLHQWYLTKDGEEWSDAMPLEPPFRDIFVMYPTLTNEGSIYFTGGDVENGHAVTQYICYSKYNGQHYETVEVLNDSINRFYWSAHPFIAPDESYLIYDAPVSRSNLTNDLYISFKDSSGVWSRSIKLNENINTDENEICPFVTRDGKYLFFTRMGDIYWVAASFIQELQSQ